MAKKKTPAQSFAQFFALYMDKGATAGEREEAERRMNTWLARHGKTRADIPAILAQALADDAASQQPPPPSGRPHVNLLDLVDRIIELHVALTPQQRLATALWVLQVYDRFVCTPRLALLSPVRGCGKTTLLELIEQLVPRPYRSDNVTAASIYYELDRGNRVLLIDEGDNLGLFNNPALRAVFNAGHRRGGTISRYFKGESHQFAVHSPMTIAAIGTLTLPLLDRAIVLQMQRAAANEQPAQRLDPSDPTFPAARTEIGKWASTSPLSNDPPMPAWINRSADNWRPLLAIADDLGRGVEAREAATVLQAGRSDEDQSVVLLRDIRSVFDRLGCEAIFSDDLVAALLALDEAPWSEWRGLTDDRPARPLTKNLLADLLRPFASSRSIWIGSKSLKGYRRPQFEAAWAAYCVGGQTSGRQTPIRAIT